MKIKRVVNYIKGLRLKPRPTWSYNGESTRTFVLCSCHPKDSLTWHWALYCNAPKFKLSWLMNMGLDFRTQKLMYKDHL
jgi:hypothetical protein